MLRRIFVSLVTLLLLMTSRVRLEAQVALPAVQQQVVELESLGGRITRDADGTVDTITLEGPQVLDQHLTLLLAFPSVRILYLNGSNVTDSGIQQLLNLPNLEEVSLRRTKVTAAAAKELKDRHPKIYFVEVDPSAMQPRLLGVAALFLPIGIFGFWLIRLTQRKRLILPRHIFVRGMAVGIFMIVACTVFLVVTMLQFFGVDFHLSDL